jgi:hypothetical protein
MTTMKRALGSVPYVVADGEHAAGVSHSRELRLKSHLQSSFFSAQISHAASIPLPWCSGCDAHYHQRSLAEVLCGRK